MSDAFLLAMIYIRQAKLPKRFDIVPMYRIDKLAEYLRTNGYTRPNKKTIIEILDN